MKRLNISFDPELIEAIATDFDLRKPNREALRQLIFALDGDYDPSVMQVLNLATGVGKTYLMAAFMEYLRRQSVGNVVIVTPGKTVQAKTIQNFTEGSGRFIRGADVAPEVVTPQDYSRWIARQNGAAELSYGREVPMLAFIFNIQQLIAPKDVDGKTHDGSAAAAQRRPRRFDENAGVLFDYLKNLDDLVVIADESHLYSDNAVAFSAALKELDPAACIGLTASKGKDDTVIFEYPLYQAIADRFVKTPVLAFRREGYGEDQSSEEQQLRDALQLRAIKQAHYDAHTTINQLPHVNAVAFVVCSDVDHATQVAELLRSPAYLGRENAVLQVDSKHDDEATQKRLDRLDAPDSPVMAVVSVNKLKEGWDVKNIAVVVTLRAMASDVLTQQTMGRGLRLPFGAYTDVPQIDQLDIISHKSFHELLSNENVLRQFGLEEAATNGDINAADNAIRDYITNTNTQTNGVPVDVPSGMAMPSGSPTVPTQIAVSTGSTPPSALARSLPSQQTCVLTGVGIAVRTIEASPTSDAARTSEDVVLETVERNPRFADVSYFFPSTTITTQIPPVLLSAIDQRDIDTAARRVTDTGDVLIRKEIIAAINRGKVKISTRDTEIAEVASMPVPREKVEDVLTHLVMSQQSIDRNEQNIRYARGYVVRNFLRATLVQEWTVKALASASNELGVLLRTFVADILRGAKEVAEVHAHPEPGDAGITLPLGEHIREHVESRDAFEKFKYYGPWAKSLFTAESFDSYSGEYLLAKLLETSPHIKWWHRLHSHNKAVIAYTAKDRYFPDFVALDDQGIYWIIEGKNEGGRADDTVQAKRRAAEEIVNRLIGIEEFADQHWGYLIAYEDDIASSDSWDDLKSKSDPITNA